MATMKEKIAEAKAAGYSDDEIFAMIAKTAAGREALESGYPAEEIRKRYGLAAATVDPDSQDPNPVTRNLKIVGGGLVKGAAAMLDLPANAITGINSLLPADWQNEGLKRIADSPGFTDLARDAGLIDRADAEPVGPGERAIDSISTGIGAAIPTMGFGAIPALISGAGSGAGEWAANELLPGNAWAQMGGAVLGGMTGQTGTKIVEKSLSKASILKELDEANLAFETFDTALPALTRANEVIKDTVQKVASNKHKQMLEAIDASVPGRVAPLQSTITGVADSLAPSVGWQDAGEALRAQADEWLKTKLPDALEASWKPVDDAVPSDTPMALGRFDSALDSINKRAGTAQSLVDVLTPSLPKVLRSKMDSILEGIDMGLAGFTWDEARKLRTALGDAMRDPKIMPSIGDTNLKQLYAALTEDLGQAAESVGAREAFDSANIASKQLFGIAEGPIAKVLDPVSSPGQMAQAMISRGAKDATELETLRAVIPGGVNALGATGLRFDPGGKLMQDWTKLSPKAKAALVPDAASRQAIDSALFSLDEMGRVVKSEKTGATLVRDTTRQTAADDFANWKVQTAEQKKTLQTRKETAKASAASLESEPSLRALERMSVGVAGSLLLDTLPGADAVMNSKAGAALMIGAPLLMHGVKNVWNDPMLLRGPGIGIATGNAMMGDEWTR